MKISLNIITLILFFFFSSANLNADGMYRISEFDILVDLASNDSKNCGLTKNDFLTETKYFFSTHPGIKYSSTADPHIYIVASIIKNNYGCTGSLNIYAKDFITYNADIIDGVFWFDGGMSQGNHSDFKNQFLKNINKFLKRFFVEWTDDN